MLLSQHLNASTAQRKKSARELRQGGSNYRCCIPALAGFVSPQSIAPDGEETYRKVYPEQQLALLAPPLPLAKERAKWNGPNGSLSRDTV
jgi:hypothetical protein